MGFTHPYLFIAELNIGYHLSITLLAFISRHVISDVSVIILMTIVY